MAKEKVVNYTPKMSLEAVTAYKASPTAETVERLASQLNRSIPSVRQHLVRQGVYIAATKKGKDKNGGDVITKEDLADQIAEYLPPLDEAGISSLAKVSKKVLKALQQVLSDFAAFKKQAMEEFGDDLSEFEQEGADMDDAVRNY